MPRSWAASASTTPRSRPHSCSTATTSSTCRSCDKPRPLLHEPPPAVVRGKGGVALVAVVHLVHLLDRVEVADDVGGAEGVARLHLLAVNLLDHHDDPAGPLARPRLVHHRRLERQPGQPRAVLAGLLVLQ